MKILFMGDIHGNLEALTVALCIAQSTRVDRINITGDIVGYGINPKECIELVKEYDCIAGNHDFSVYNPKYRHKYNYAAACMLQWTKDALDSSEVSYLASLPFSLTYENEGYQVAHGGIRNPKAFNYILNYSDAQLDMAHMAESLLFIGHTHEPMVWSKTQGFEPIGHHKYQLDRDQKYIINVGSVGQPRDDNPRGCLAIYDTEEYSVKFLRFEYDVEWTITKMKEHNIPTSLYKRLQWGR